MLRQALYTRLLLLLGTIVPGYTWTQLPFDPDTVQFVKVSGPELSEIYKNDMVFDRHGVLWVATQVGLYAFDGYDWKSGLSLPDDPLLNVDQWLESVQCDSAGYIWFGSQVSGVHRLDPQSMEVRAFPGGAFTGDPIHTILGNELALSDGMLYALTNRGFLELDPYAEIYHAVHVPFPEKTGGTIYGLAGAHPLNAIQHYLADQEDPNTAWLATRAGIVRYAKDTQAASAFPWPFTNPQLPSGQKITAIDLHQSGDSLLAGTYGSGFVTYYKDQSRWRVDLVEPEEVLHARHRLLAELIAGHAVGRRGIRHRRQELRHLVALLIGEGAG
ncbi:MAG: hypothetical protein R3330_06030 [Saprospiraceae bacterium]|nr:hypothetical protein [Saprospiraceae bacterium]